MMNMMDRFVEGRGHVREIDMLLELTCVRLAIYVSVGRMSVLNPLAAGNKSRAKRFVRSAMRPRGPSRGSCATSVSAA